MLKTIQVYEKFVVVEGWDDFPIDMLRYDSAFPMTEEDSGIAANGPVARGQSARGARLGR